MSDQSLICPVMDVPVTEATAREKELVVEHEGKEYFMCCNGCLSTFQKDPQKYIGDNS